MSWRFATLAGALAQQAKDRPHAVAVRFIAPGGEALASSALCDLTFGELHDRAVGVAAALAQSAKPGERALLLCPPGLDYVAALFGCFYAGVVAVPAYPPAAAGLDERLTRLIEDSAPRVILTIEAIADICRALAGHGRSLPAEPQVASVDALDLGEHSGAAYTGAPGDLALLQYTSGSTSDPRGVMLTHANLLTNIASISSQMSLAGDTRVVSWLPPFHDMGLVSGVLASVVLGAETTLMSPLSFLASPLLWLEAVSRYRGTFSAAPDFAYELCVRKVTPEQATQLDLSSWRSVVNGAEPVREETMDRFAARFVAAGFRRSAFMPAYGLAEATLLVSTRRLSEHGVRAPTNGAVANGRTGGAGSEAPHPVSVGTPDKEATLLIVDPETRREVAEGEIGEIWVHGPSVGGGYWSSPAKTQSTFGATLSDDPGGRCFLRTGDLGALREGELYVHGRLKDLIIVRGQNYHPHDVEHAASEADSQLRPGCLAAFEVDQGRGQEAVLVAEAAGELEDDGWAVFERVRAAVAVKVGLGLDELVLIERSASIKTSSGKIRRAATRHAYLNEELPVVARYRSPHAAAGAEATATAVDQRERGVGAAPNGAGHTRALLEQHLSEYTRRERDAVVRLTVLVQLAPLLGDVAPGAIDPARTFKELGLESLQTVELSGRLQEATGLELAPTVCFEHPTPEALAAHLSSRLAPAVSGPIGRDKARTSGEAVAIVGMGCRFPGGVDSPESMWALVGGGADAITRFPRDRGWDLERLFDADPERPGTSRAREGGFLEDAAGFDAGFFDIGAAQADAMDPQQRVLLEVAWEALEHAGIDPSTLEGSLSAVFAGVSSVDHAIRLGATRSRELEAHLLTGAAASAVSGRLSYTLGLRGPAVTVDTACSSSLVAIHEACRALAEGECSLALAGGVTVLSTPAVFTGFSRRGGLAADGRCKPFAAAADGTGFAEGAGLLVLERLADAQKRGHRVLALVRGSAVNQDGKSNGFTAPSPSSQEGVIGAALAAAGLKGDEVDAVEAHGTGTVLGDPIEARALIAAYGEERTRPLWVGSVKSNLGHTQAAAGVAGVIKMVMAMRHDVLPQTLHVDEASSLVDWSAGAVSLLSSAQAWPRRRRPRRAGVSSFGISGTNAHVILEEPRSPTEPEPPAPPAVLPWSLSARSGSALRRQAERLRAYLLRSPEISVLDVAYTLARGRARMEHRAAIVGGDRDELLGGLGALVDDTFLATVSRARARKNPKVAFVFGGQGAQWEGMARELMESSAVFAQSVRACSRALSTHVDWSLEDVLRGADGTPALRRVDIVQPALWAVMVSLAELWRSLGVRPAIVVGHSQGEIAAAHVAGGLSLDDAARLVAIRGQALRELQGKGGMVSLALGATKAAQLVARFEPRLSLAACNGPHTTVVSGDIDALDELRAICEAEGIRSREIAVDFASHSRHVEAISERFTRSLSMLQPCSGDVPFFSCLAAEVMDTADLDGEYWYRSLREPVRFADATQTLLRDGCSVFIEMSPHPVLAVPMQEAIDEHQAGEEVAVIASLRRGSGDRETFVHALGEAFVRGVEVDWSPLFSGQHPRLAALPTYPFERERHWLMPAPADAESGAPRLTENEHPLLPTSIALADRDACLFHGRVSLETHPWLADHTVLGAIMVPASVFLELALHAGSELGCEEVDELSLEAPLVVPDDGEIELQVSVSEVGEDGRRALVVASRPAAESGEDGNEWRHHARGKLVPTHGLPPPSEGQPGLWPPPGAEPIELDYVHDRLAELGISYGPTLQRLRAAWRKGHDVFAELAPAGQDGRGGFLIDPAIVDSLLQAASVSAAAPQGRRVLMPFAWSAVRARAVASSALRARLTFNGDSLALMLADQDGVPVLTAREVLMRPFEAAAMRSSNRQSERELLLALDWVGVSLPAQGDQPDGVAVLGDAPIGAIATPRYVDPAAVADAMRADTSVRFVLAAPSTDDESAAGVRDAARGTLSLLQSWLAEEWLGDCRLVVLTNGAVAARDGETPNLAGSALWGLLRSAQAEHPGRFALVDLDGSSASWGMLRRALVLDEPQLALRDGELLVPRLSPCEQPRDAGHMALDPGGTVLITGATGELGRLFARHLVASCGTRHLLLCSRDGPVAEGAAVLAAELAALGCDARLVACDVTDRAALERLLAEVPSARPLTAVFHAAGILDDGLLESLTSERLDRVMAPKVDAAIALAELTAGIELSAFVLISSAVATIGGAGQANYAAANAVLDALAVARQARGLVGQSLAFGLWRRDAHSEGGDALAQLESQIRTRMGMLPLERSRGLALLDDSLAAPDAFLVPIRLDMEALRASAQVDAISPVLRGLVRRPRGGDDSTRALRRRLELVSSDEREAILARLVFDEVASVVACERSEITSERTLVDLGGESLDTLELRNRLEARTGVRLPARVFFREPLRSLTIRLRDALEESAPRRPASQLRSTTLRTLLESARESGKVAELVSTLIEASRLRPTCDRDCEPPRATMLSAASSAPQVICIPSFMAGSGAHQFVRLARAFEGRRPLSALDLPGWRLAEAAPATWAVAIEAISAAVRTTAGEQAYVLLGYSSGGALAHAVAEHCEAEDRGPAGVVLIDTYAPRNGDVFATMLGEIVDRSHEYLEIDDDELIAMGTFLRLAGDWRAGTVRAPGLYLRAATPLPALPDPEPLSAPFAHPQAEVSLEADHFTIIGDDAQRSAAAIDAWLGQLVGSEHNGSARTGEAAAAHAGEPGRAR